MLSEARRHGIVAVTVSHPIERLMALEERLTRAFGLKEARVAEDRADGASGPGTEVTRVCGGLLPEHCGPRSVIAVSNGRAVGAVVAHVCGHHLDAEGNHVRTALCDRTLCLDPSRLSVIPLVIGVAAGRDKVDALRATLRGDYLSALVTDENTARSLLEGV